MSLATPFLRARRHPAAAPLPVLLVGSGDHAEDLEPVLRALPECADVVVVLRMATREDRIAGATLAELTLQRGGRLVELSGTRAAVALDAARLRSLVGDLAGRDVHVAGPPTFACAALAAARAAGVPAARTHRAAAVR